MATLAARAADDARRRLDSTRNWSTRPNCAACCPRSPSTRSGGLVARHNGFARPYRTTLAFRRAAEAAGATVREGAAVVGLDAQGGALACALRRRHHPRAPVLVNTAGAWGARLARAVGEEIPLRLQRADDDLHLGAAAIRDAGRRHDRQADVVQAGAERARHDRRRPQGRRQSRDRAGRARRRAPGLFRAHRALPVPDPARAPGSCMPGPASRACCPTRSRSSASRAPRPAWCTPSASAATASSSARSWAASSPSSPSTAEPTGRSPPSPPTASAGSRGSRRLGAAAARRIAQPGSASSDAA